MDFVLTPEQEMRVENINYIFVCSDPIQARVWDLVVRRLVHLGFYFNYIHRLCGVPLFNNFIMVHEEPFLGTLKYMKVYYCLAFVDSLYVLLEDYITPIHY